MAQRFNKEDIEKIYGKCLAEKELEIVGIKKPVLFEIYDGYAYCEEHKGHSYQIEFPLISLVEQSKKLQNDIREWTNLDEDKDITIYEIIQTFNTLYIDHKPAYYDKESKKWLEMKHRVDLKVVTDK